MVGPHFSLQYRDGISNVIATKQNLIVTGSLIARILFQPIEETSRLYFSKHLSLSISASNGNPRPETQAVEWLSASVKLLFSLLDFYAYLGLLFITFGPPFVYSALLILLGSQSPYLHHGPQSTVVQVLRAYCSLLPLLGLNGVIEAFVQSAANEADLSRLSKLMVAWCAVFISAVAVFSSSWASHLWGITPEVGMVLATGINMSCRIGFGWIFANRYLHQRGSNQSLSLSRFSPSLLALFGFIVAAIVTRWNEFNSLSFFTEPFLSAREIKSLVVWQRLFHHLSIGLICFFGCFFLTLFTEWKRLSSIFSTITSRPKAE
ncbi:hypothetical protein O181_012316 [Austropuccinia psidii MF-1]|uniref:Man(5)GlcNAc(2)-PP-dolichol translocation protein RFT1 n=1 Tax=Austropuccinia psidii MF-1 TaxID=1389203 RepID=A0A9Q3GM74_9BASI|nr:hypothetical protein [Austropuccinia psidii MF-1]